MEAFGGPRLKIKRAIRHYGELGELLHNYGHSVQFRYEPIPNNLSQEILRFDPPPPKEEISAIVGDCVHNLRASLDLMICDIARVRGKSAAKLKFPIAATQSDFEEAIRIGEIRRLGRDVQDAVKQLKAYKGGNVLLRGLHDLDIADKHDLIIPVMACFFLNYDVEGHMEEMLREANPGADIPRIISIGTAGSGMRVLEVDGGQVPADLEFRQWLKAEENPATALFGDNQPFARAHVLPKLEELIHMTGAIVETFANQFSPPPSPAA